MKKPYFPMFVDLAGKQIKVIGGGKIAAEAGEDIALFWRRHLCDRTEDSRRVLFFGVGRNTYFF